MPNFMCVISYYFALGPSSLRSPANSGELRRTRRSLGGGGHPQRLSRLAPSLAALIRYNDPLSQRLCDLATESVNLYAIAFDHRVRQQLVRDFGGERSRLRRLGRREIQLEVLALPHILDGAVAERMQRIGDRAALRIEHGRLERYEDTGSH